MVELLGGSHLLLYPPQITKSTVHACVRLLSLFIIKIINVNVLTQPEQSAFSSYTMEMTLFQVINYNDAIYDVLVSQNENRIYYMNMSSAFQFLAQNFANGCTGHTSDGCMVYWFYWYIVLYHVKLLEYYKRFSGMKTRQGHSQSLLL